MDVLYRMADIFVGQHFCEILDEVVLVVVIFRDTCHDDRYAISL